MAKAYDVPGTWAAKCSNMQAADLPGGHFFIDSAPNETVQALKQFFARYGPAAQ